MATAGLIMGYIGLALVLVVICLLVIAVAILGVSIPFLTNWFTYPSY